MITKWTSHLQDPKEKEAFQKEVQGSRQALDRLYDIALELEIELDRYENSLKQYELPAWEYKQADNNGFRRCLSVMKKFYNLDQKDPK